MSSAKWTRRGHQAFAQGALGEARKAYRKALKRDPRAAEPLAALCHLYSLQGQIDEALPHAQVIHAHPYPPHAKRNAGLVFYKLGQHEEALACFLAATPLERNDTLLIPHLNGTAMRLADWPTASRCQQYLTTCFQQGDFRSALEHSFRALGWCGRDDWNRVIAADFWRRHAPANVTTPPPALPAPVAGRALRVGYLSADWRQHATLELMIGLFEQHDPSAVEVVVYCHSDVDDSPPRRRLQQAVPNIVSLHALSDAEAAARIRTDALDILIDCKGYTKGNRTPILGYRPAPIQVNFLAFPGSLGTDVHDYLIGDRYVTPPGCDAAFSEAICRLPDSYFATDNRRPLATTPVTRADEGLPEKGVVFCCFNQPYKLESVRWQTFMAILRDVPGSVLWLLDPGATAADNLRREATHCDVAPQRLVFASRRPSPEHLTRIALADMALDTRIYNGHTTTADALWAGVPVLATGGMHFASRVSESLLRAMALPELVMSDEAELHRRAVALATTPGALARLGDRVRENRRWAPLFDTVRFTRQLEEAYRIMVERAVAGQPPRSFDV